jgi:hypothetical protein
MNIKHYASVFISRTEEMAVIATLHFSGEGGILYEDSEPVALSLPLEAIILGQTVLVALRGTSIKQLATKRKLTDWPSFKASKAASVRQFEKNFIGVLVSGANDVNLAYVIDAEPSKGAELHITSSISSSAPPEKVGERILSVFRACRDRRI